MKKEEAIEQMKKDFSKIWGMTYEEFEERISTPEMKILVEKLRRECC